MLKSILDQNVKAIVDELSSFIFYYQAIRTEEDQSKSPEQIEGEARDTITELCDSISDAQRVVDSMPQDVQYHATTIYKEGHSLVQQVFDDSMHLFFGIIIRGNENPDLTSNERIERGSKEVTDGIDAVKKSTDALFDTES